MTQFSHDIDLLKWEPVLFRELALPSQTLCRGEDGETNGTLFNSETATFASSRISAGHVITLQNNDRSIDSSYAIVSVNSETELTISVVRRTDDISAAAVPSDSELTYQITSYDPQAEEAAMSLLHYFGLVSDSACLSSYTFDDIVAPEVLRQCSVFSVLSSLFTAAAMGSKDSSGYWDKSLRYQKLFETSRARTQIKIDTDNDDIPDELRSGGSVRLRRL